MVMKRQRLQLNKIIIILLCSSAVPAATTHCCWAFQQQSRTRRRTTPRLSSSSQLWAAVDPQEQDADVNGGLVTQADANKSQLFSAFASLDLSDQYDAVLCSACAKILDADGPSSSEAETRTKLADCQQLLQEMNDSRVAASPRSLMALVDVRAIVCLGVCWLRLMLYAD